MVGYTPFFESWAHGRAIRVLEKIVTQWSKSYSVTTGRAQRGGNVQGELNWARWLLKAFLV